MPMAKVVVVEDADDWRERLREFVGELGYATDVAGTRSEAIQKISAAPHDYALILLDPNLTPTGDDHEGLRILDALIALGIRKPFILLTAYLTVELLVNLVNNYSEHDMVAVFDKADFSRSSEGIRKALARAMATASGQMKPTVSPSGQRRPAYTDFCLHVAPNGEIRARSSRGQRTDSVSPILPTGVAEAANRIEYGKADERTLREFGSDLFDTLFPDRIRTLLGETEAVANSRGNGVRIRLTIESDALACLPWEFTYLQDRGKFLALDPDIIVSRYLESASPEMSVKPTTLPLNLLTIVSSPSAPNLEPLDPEHWEKIVSGALGEVRPDKIEAHTVKKATFEAIRDAIFEQPPDIVQFVGHGVYADGKGYLVLVDDVKGEPWLVDDMQFASIFRGTGAKPRLFILASCESAKSESPRAFLGVAPRLVQLGVPAVIAMQYPVLISTAEVFLENLYVALAASKPIDWAVQSARSAIAVRFGLDNREFGTPVLYMRAKNGNIF
jgi:CheY-like chemotaxis protein